MKKFSSSFLCLSMLLASCMQADDCCSEDGTTASSPVRSLVLPRSQGSNTARELLGWQDYIHLGDCDGTYTAVTAAFEYTRSFRAGRIARQLFGISTPSAAQGCGDNDVLPLRFQGSEVANRLSTS